MQARLSLDKSKLKFLLLEGIHPSAVEALNRDGYHQLETHAQALAGDELIAAIRDAHFVGLRSRSQLTEAVLSQAPKLTAIGCFCIGTNQVDLQAAARHGIPVFNAPFSNTRSVAELVLGEIIMLLRGIPEKRAPASWRLDEERCAFLGGARQDAGHHRLRPHRYADRCARRAARHGGNFLRYRSQAGARQRPTGVHLDELLAAADVVSLHVPETAATQNMIAAPQLAQMRRGSYLINASRGTVVDIAALADALDSRHLQGAAIDVFPAEPKGNDDPFVSPLLRFDNVILTPHIGGSTAEAQANIGVEVAAKLIRYSNNGSTASAVNFPEVSLPEHTGKSRLLHIHKNIPGVLARINERFSLAGINIAAQYLQTTADVGYVVIDVDAAASRIALDELEGIEGTIRCRILY